MADEVSNSEYANARLFQESEKVGMDDIESAVCLALLNDARDVNLAGTWRMLALALYCSILVRTLRDHLDVDIVVTKHAEELATDTDHVLELLANQAHDGHVGNNVNGAQLAEVVDSALKILVLDLVLVHTTTAQHGGLRVQGHRDVDLGRRNEIHRQVPAVQDAEDVHQETMSTGALVAVHIQDDDVVLDGDSSGAPGRVQRVQKAGGAGAEETIPQRRV